LVGNLIRRARSHWSDTQPKKVTRPGANVIQRGSPGGDEIKMIIWNNRAKKRMANEQERRGDESLRRNYC